MNYYHTEFWWNLIPLIPFETIFAFILTYTGESVGEHAILFSAIKVIRMRSSVLTFSP